MISIAAAMFAGLNVAPTPLQLTDVLVLLARVWVCICMFPPPLSYCSTQGEVGVIGELDAVGFVCMTASTSEATEGAPDNVNVCGPAPPAMTFEEADTPVGAAMSACS